MVVVAGAGGIAASTHRLDDAVRTVGLKPRAEPVASDDTLIAKVAHDQNVLLGLVEAVVARHAALASGLSRFAQIGQAQVKAVGGSSQVPGAPQVDADPARAVDALSKAYAAASKARAADAGRAVSPDLARVLSSMSAGLAQCAHTVGDLR
ncbi:MAG: hypothetical protein JWR83_528 [Aeromicrobium sp.]|nr:hypothetical protein [Aeromicrobium sp.]